MSMTYSLSIIFFCLLILVPIVFFVVSLALYISAKRKNRQVTSPYIQKEMATYKVLLIISSVILGLLLAVVITFAVLFFFAIAFM